MSRSSHRRNPGPRCLRTLLAAWLGFAGGAASSAQALSELELFAPSEVVVDRGTFTSIGNYLQSTAGFDLVGSTSPFLELALFVPRTTSDGGIDDPHFDFLLEDPANPGSFDQTERDLSLTWNPVTGVVTSEPFRVRMDLYSFATSVAHSFFELTLTSNATASFSCGSNGVFQPLLNGQSLPPGPLPPGGATLRLVAKACPLAVDPPNGIDANGLPNHGLVVGLGAHVPDPECANGADDDGDGLADGADPGCADAADAWERGEALVCDNGLDDDLDGLVDYLGDPGCGGPLSVKEDPKCDDGLDNDGDLGIDWDGAGIASPDAQCVGKPWRDSEGAGGRCGLGFELTLLVPLLASRRSRRRAIGEVACSRSGTTTRRSCYRSSPTD